MQLDNRLKNAALNGMRTLLNGAKIRILTDTNVVLADVAVNNAFAEATNGSMTATPIEDNAADADGVASKFEIYDSNGVLATGTVGVSSSNADMRIANTQIVQGATFRITSITFNAA